MNDNNNNARYKRQIELRDSGLNTNTEICFEVRKNALGPRLHTEGFSLCPHRTFHKGTSTEELQLNSYSTQLLSNTITSTQEGRHKAKEKYNLVITKITNNLLVILKDH